MIYKWHSSYPCSSLYAAITSKLSTLTDCHFLPVSSFRPFHELNDDLSLFSVSWLCFSAETMSFWHTVQQVSHYGSFFFFSFSSQWCAASEEKVKLRSAYSFISLTHPSLTQHWSSNALHMRSPSLQPASVSLKSTDNKVCESSIVPCDLQDLSFDAVTRVLRHFCYRANVKFRPLHPYSTTLPHIWLSFSCLLQHCVSLFIIN